MRPAFSRWATCSLLRMLETCFLAVFTLMPKLLGDFGVGELVGDQFEHLPFSWREGV